MGGEIFFEGSPLSRMRQRERRAVRNKFSYMFQGTALFDSMTVYENVALPLKERTRMPASTIREKVGEKMTQLDLHDVDGKFPSQLSGGMKKRVALARALVTDPEIVLFDEPTTGLDPIRKNAVHSMIAEYQQKFGFTGVVVSHEIPDIFFISQRIAMLDEGHIVFEGDPEELMNTTDPVVQQFIHGLETRHDAMVAGFVPQPQAEKRFRQEMARLQRHATIFSIVVFSVNNLEEIHDAMGHVTGQTVLKNFATQIQKCIRITDTCSRYGMNKIVLILANTDREQARSLCRKLAGILDGKQILGIKPTAEFCLSISAGHAEARHNWSMSRLVEEAESVQETFFEFKVC